MVALGALIFVVGGSAAVGSSSKAPPSTGVKSTPAPAPTRAADAPANDNFADAIVLAGTSATRTGDTNAGATLETGEPDTVADVPSSASVWYVWTAPSSTFVTVHSHGSDFDTQLAAYTGAAVNALASVAENDDFTDFNDSTSLIQFWATSGTTYRIRLGGYFGAVGTIDLSLATASSPTNDNFGSATFPLQPIGGVGRWRVSTAGGMGVSTDLFTVTP